MSFRHIIVHQEISKYLSCDVMYSTTHAITCDHQCNNVWRVNCIGFMVVAQNNEPLAATGCLQYVVVIAVAPVWRRVGAGAYAFNRYTSISLSLIFPPAS